MIAYGVEYCEQGSRKSGGLSIRTCVTTFHRFFVTGDLPDNLQFCDLIHKNDSHRTTELIVDLVLL